MPRRSWITASLSALALALPVLGSAPSAAANPAPEPAYGYSGSAAGTFINVLGGAIRSDLTAGSSLDGTTFPAATSNSTAAVEVPGLVAAGVIETSGSAEGDQSQMVQTMKASTARVELLDGLIQARALNTTATARKVGGNLSGDVSTAIVDLTIAGQRIPIGVGKNFHIEVPGVAAVTINESDTVVDGGAVVAKGSALKVRLLKMIDSYEPGTVVIVNPITASLSPVTSSDATPVAGYAYVTSLNADVLGAKAKSDPTSYIATSSTGTNGFTRIVSLLRVTLPGLVEAGVVETTTTATSVPRTAVVTHTAEAARVKLLGGLLTADAIKVTARVRKLDDGTVVREPETEFVNLRLFGAPIKLGTKANETLALPGLISIVANEQITTPNGVTVTALHIKVLAPVGQFPAGVDLKVAVANSEAY